MKTSFIIGWVAMFISLVFMNSIIEQGSGINSTQMDWLNSLINPDIVNMSGLQSTPLLGQAYTLAVMVGKYVATFILMIMLWFPSVWSGNWIWVYYFFCLPVSIGFIVSLVFVLRGVRAG